MSLTGEDPALGGVSLGEVGVEFERALRRRPAEVADPGGEETGITLAQGLERPGSGIGRIEVDGPLAQTDHHLPPARPAGQPVASRHQIELVGFRIVG